MSSRSTATSPETFINRPFLASDTLHVGIGIDDLAGMAGLFGGEGDHAVWFPVERL